MQPQPFIRKQTDEEIRIKAAELSAMIVSQISIPILLKNRDGNDYIKPLALAKYFEDYIKSGEIDNRGVNVYTMVQ
jgi:hypothetical protein